jgi:hypothetical protein
MISDNLARSAHQRQGLAQSTMNVAADGNMIEMVNGQGTTIMDSGQGQSPQLYAQMLRQQQENQQKAQAQVAQAQAAVQAQAASAQSQQANNGQGHIDVTPNDLDTSPSPPPAMPSPVSLSNISTPGAPRGGKRRPGRPPKDPVAFFTAWSAKLGKGLNVGKPKALKIVPKQSDTTSDHVDKTAAERFTHRRKHSPDPMLLDSTDNRKRPKTVNREGLEPAWDSDQPRRQNRIHNSVEVKKKLKGPEALMSARKSTFPVVYRNDVEVKPKLKGYETQQTARKTAFPKK